MWQQTAALISVLFAAGVLKDKWPVSWLLKRLISQPAEEMMDRRIEGSETSRKVDLILAELHPNGGTSVRDAIDRTEAKADLAAMTAATAAAEATTAAAKAHTIERRQRRQQSQLAGTNARLDDLAERIGK